MARPGRRAGSFFELVDTRPQDRPQDQFQPIKSPLVRLGDTDDLVNLTAARSNTADDFTEQTFLGGDVVIGIETVAKSEAEELFQHGI